MREGMAAAAEKDRRYNVAYVKHNRFLSPSQKQAVSPKVTEVIPVSPEPIKIYGKPKVKLDDQFFELEEDFEKQRIASQQNIPNRPSEVKIEMEVES
jgi:hypothetical protein